MYNTNLTSKGYRHWASADEAQLEQFGDISYMMALKLTSPSSAKRERSAGGSSAKGLAKRLTRDWPEVHMHIYIYMYIYIRIYIYIYIYIYSPT